MEDLQKQNNILQSELERMSKAQKSLSILPTGEIKKHLLGSDRELVALRQGKENILVTSYFSRVNNICSKPGTITVRSPVHK